MNATYDRLTATALRLIETFGQPVTWKQTRASTTLPDPAKPWEPVANTAAGLTHTVHMAFFPPSSASQGSLQDAPGSDVPVLAGYGLMGAVDFEPSLQDTLIRDGVTLDIIRIKATAPAGQVVLYRVDFT